MFIIIILVAFRNETPMPWNSKCYNDFNTYGIVKDVTNKGK